MKVLMLGWEFPPFFAGGVGIVCYELTKALSKHKDVEITYIMPFGPSNIKSDKTKHIDLIVADNIIADSNVKIKIETVDTLFQAYMTPEEYRLEYEKLLKEGASGEGKKSLYGKNLYLEVQRYAEKVKDIVRGRDFDVIHAHDWMTFPAGIAAKKVLNKPLVIHVHNTVYDRYLGKGGDYEKKIETDGVREADLVISISNFVSQNLIQNYGADPNKIRLVYNGGVTDFEKLVNLHPYDIVQKKEKIVSYLGRVVMQKGPEYFVRAALKVLDYEPDVKFLIAGTGHLVEHLRYLVKEAGKENNFLITGKQYTREEGDHYFSISDIFVMPSPSEPFGIVPLEAIGKGTPVIISKQSGISEVLNNCFKVDYWDIDEMAHKIICLLRYGPLHSHMREASFAEFDKFEWEEPAKKVVDVYTEAIQNSKRLLLN